MPSLHSLKTLGTLVLGFLLLAISPAVNAQTAQVDEQRQRAFQLYKDARYVEALPLFEKLALVYPEDREVIEAYGIVVVSQAIYLKDPAARKQARVRGREILLRAQKLGANSTILKWMLEEVVPANGGDITFSNKKEIDDAMREGEGAFAGGNYAKALEMYQRVLLLDPTLYEAALFTGDVYFATADQKKASEWFARAVDIDPNRETAYRYWGDSLIKQGRITEAGEKFVEAYIAEPYSRLAYGAFVSWAQRLNVSLAHPKVELPASVARKNDKETTVTLDPSLFKKSDDKGASAAWLMYSLSRTAWQNEFTRHYPNEKTYRHSLNEEVEAFRAALKQLNDAQGDASLQVLKKLEKEGLLEAFILLALPDEGIAQDFPAYRKTNIENLRRYVKNYVLTGGGTNQ